MLKIDTHAHFLPMDWPDLAAKYGDLRFPVIHHGDDGRCHPADPSRIACNDLT